jgi:hypothetical protein
METDTEPKWLRPIDPLVAASLPIRVDPRLGVDDDIAHRLQRDAEPLLTIVTVFVTSNYDNVLAAEVANDAEHGLHVLVRAATVTRPPTCCIRTTSRTRTDPRAPAVTSLGNRLKSLSF